MSQTDKECDRSANCSVRRYHHTPPLKRRAWGVEEEPPSPTGSRHLGEDQMGTTAQPDSGSLSSSQPRTPGRRSQACLSDSFHCVKGRLAICMGDILLIKMVII